MRLHRLIDQSINRSFKISRLIVQGGRLIAGPFIHNVVYQNGRLGWHFWPLNASTKYYYVVHYETLFVVCYFVFFIKKKDGSK